MPTSLLRLVAPVFVQGLMAKKQEEAEEQMEHRMTRPDISTPARRHFSMSANLVTSARQLASHEARVADMAEVWDGPDRPGMGPVQFKLGSVQKLQQAYGASQL